MCNQPPRHGSILPRRCSLAAVAFLTAAAGTISAIASPPTSDRELFNRLDANHDGKVEATEIQPDQQRLFERLLRRGDSNSDHALAADEFAASLKTTRPEKPLEDKQSATIPQANAVRWLLLSLDIDRNARIDSSEVPPRLQRVYQTLTQRLDTNKNGNLESMELTRGGPPLGQIAGRYVQQNRIDVEADLKRFEAQQGAAVNRFEERPARFDQLADPEKARQLFVQFDANNDGQLELKEVPEPLQRPIQRLLRTADRNRDGQLSAREFLTGVQRMNARRPRLPIGAMPDRDTLPGATMPSEESMRANDN